MMLNNAEKQNTPQEHHEILPHHKILIQFYNGYLWNIFIITVRNSSCGKVMFSQACVKNSVHSGGVCLGPQADTPLNRHPQTDTPLADTSLGRPPSRQTPHGQTPPPPDGHCSRRYTSYWNEFFVFNVYGNTIMYTYKMMA